MEHTPSNFRGLTHLFIYAILMALIGVFTNHIHGLSSNAVAFIRSAVAAVFILGAIAACKDWQALKLRHVGNTVIIGVAYAGMAVCFVGALMKTSVANAVLFAYTAPCFAVIFSKFALKDDIPRSAFGGLLLSLMGLCLIPDASELSLNSEMMVGNLFGLGSGISYAVIMVASKPLAKKTTPTYIAFWQQVIATIVLIPVAWFDTSLTLETAQINLLPLAGLGILCTGIAFLIFFRGVSLVPTHHALVMTSLEPVIAIIIAALLLGQSMSVWTMTGAAFIVIGVYQITSATNRSTKLVPQPALATDAYKVAL